VFLFLKKFERSIKYTANANQYLVLKYIDGKIEHKPGYVLMFILLFKNNLVNVSRKCFRPLTVWFNRFQYESIQVKDSYKLDQSEMIIVYNRNEKNDVRRRVVKGPCLFFPQANEWLHEFQWHHPDSNNFGYFVYDSTKFVVLKTQPEYLHYFVISQTNNLSMNLFYYFLLFVFKIKEVRTLDDTNITVKLMVIYQLEDVETMLNKTQDPISDFIK